MLVLCYLLFPFNSGHNHLIMIYSNETAIDFLFVLLLELAVRTRLYQILMVKVKESVGLDRAFDLGFLPFVLRLDPRLGINHCHYIVWPIAQAPVMKNINAATISHKHIHLKHMACICVCKQACMKTPTPMVLQDLCFSSNKCFPFLMSKNPHNMVRSNKTHQYPHPQS